MKKSLVISLAALSITTWLLVFFLLVDDHEPNKAVNHQGIAFHKDTLENGSEQFVDLKANNREESTFTLKQVRHEQETGLANPTQTVMYEMEKKNPISIDKLLNELNIN
ncbi:hypothetical protein [Paraliobacillus sp. JSM ZJ581]|uniref:hypothetical protein n=1 Tax=Paraliobacillus sp. JSM ZJ581 TaxID=3342118 RepID=UPI0035A9A49A